MTTPKIPMIKPKPRFTFNFSFPKTKPITNPQTGAVALRIEACDADKVNEA